MQTRYLALVALATVAVLPGCQGSTDGTNGGLTNGPPPTTSREKAAVRSDVPQTPPAGQGEILGATGDASNNAGSAGSGGGAAMKGTAGAGNSESVRANPPAKTAPDAGSAAGGTKAPDTIQTGTPRSPH